MKVTLLIYLYLMFEVMIYALIEPRDRLNVVFPKKVLNKASITAH